MDPQPLVPSPRHSDTDAPNNSPEGFQTEERKRPHLSLRRILLRSLSWPRREQQLPTHPQPGTPRPRRRFRVGWRRLSFPRVRFPRARPHRTFRKHQKSKQQQTTSLPPELPKPRTQGIYPVTQVQHHKDMPAAHPVAHPRTDWWLNHQTTTIPPKVNPDTEIIIAVMGVTGKLQVYLKPSFIG